MHRVPYIVTLGTVDGRVLHLLAYERKETGGGTGERGFAGIAQVIQYQDKYLPATRYVELG